MFNLAIEKQLLALLIRDKTFTTTVLPYLNEEVFAFPLHRYIFKVLKEHNEKYGALPSTDGFLSVITEKNPHFASQELETLARIVFEVFSDETVLPDAAYIKENVQHLVQVAVLRSTICNAGVLLEQGKVEEIYTTLEKAKLATSFSTEGFVDIIEDFEKQWALIRNRKIEKIPTGLQNLDLALGGGLVRGELGVILAPVNLGKTMALNNLAINAARNDKTTLLISMELSETDTFARILSSCLRLPTNQLETIDEETVRKLLPQSHYLRKKLFIAAYPTKSLGINHISALVKRFEVLHGKLDLLILDSADNLRLKGNELRIELGDLYQKLRGICGEDKIGMWTCSQVNRLGMEAFRVKSIHTAESIDKIFTADVVLTLSQSDSEYPDRARLMVGKARRTQKYQEIPLFLQYDMALVQEQPGFRLTQTLSADQVNVIKQSLGICEEEPVKGEVEPHEENL